MPLIFKSLTPYLGGFQDYSYIVAGCFDITLELGCCKFPPEADLEEYWNDNREALIEYLLQAQIGTSNKALELRGSAKNL